MLLLLDHAAASALLTDATHVVLMEPVTGTQARIDSVERLAIGRAYRTHKHVSHSLSLRCFFHPWIFSCARTIANWHFRMPTKSHLEI